MQKNILYKIIVISNHESQIGQRNHESKKKMISGLYQNKKNFIH